MSGSDELGRYRVFHVAIFQGSGRFKVSVLAVSARIIQGMLRNLDALCIWPNDAGPATRKLHPHWEGHGTQPAGLKQMAHCLAHHSLLKLGVSMVTLPYTFTKFPEPR